MAPLLFATPEGVYVFQGLGVDHLELFNHEGQYVRTLYPFPADKIDKVSGLQRQTHPHDGKSLPSKIGFNRSTMLSSGTSGMPADTGGHFGGFGATAMAVKGNRIALAYVHLNRLFTDGTSGGLPIKGPRTCIEIPKSRGGVRLVGPTSMAFSPDGKWLYLTGYVWNNSVRTSDCRHAVYRMAFEGDEPPKVFLGKDQSDGGYGKDNAHFTVPTSVDVDSKGRLYVSDYLNDRIQIFTPEGKYLKTLPVLKPARVVVDPLSNEIFAFSWVVVGPSNRALREADLGHLSSTNPRLWTTVSRLGVFEKPVKGKPQKFAAGEGHHFYGTDELGGQTYQVSVDPWAKSRTVWVVGRRPTASAGEMNWSGGFGVVTRGGGIGIRILAEKDGTWAVKTNFAKRTQDKVIRVARSDFSRQRLFFNPLSEELLVGEDVGFWKSFDEMIVIEPRTGKLKEIALPFDAEDLCFDLEGRAHLRTDRVVMRFDSRNWREIPWDYGEERMRVHYQGFTAPRRSVNAIGALATPGRRPVDWHMGGLAISPRGHMAVSCKIRADKRQKALRRKEEMFGKDKAYRPTQYPGRYGDWVIHVWDRHGELIHEDAFPGFMGSDGLAIDQEDGLYGMVRAQRVLGPGTKAAFNKFSETLIKFKPGRSKIISASGRAPVKLPDELKPKRVPELSKAGETWVENAEWFYGGVGYGGQTGSCVCWSARFTMDSLNRSFVPELERFRVAVLDSEGNLILRIGRYGNIQDGKPMVPAGGPKGLRALGGDEVAFMHAAYLATDTDRRLFVHDAGNRRILSVKLDYHMTEMLPLKGIPRK